MFKSLYYIGKTESENQHRTPEQIILEGNISGIDKTIEIQVDDNNSECKIDVVLTTIDRANKTKYGTYGANKNGANIVCYEIVDGKNALSSFKGNPFSHITKAFRSSFVKALVQHPVIDIFSSNSEVIESKLNQLKLDKKSKYLMTFSYNGLYPYGIPEFNEYIITESHYKNGHSEKTKAFKEHGKCTICNRDGRLIVGLLYLDETFMFFNYGSASNAREFQISNAYKDTSICFECAEFVNLGSRIVVSRTKASVPWMKDKKGMSCVSSIVLPRLLSQDTSNGIEAFNDVTNQYLSRRNDPIQSSEKTLGLLEDIIAEQQNVVCFDFIFFSPAQRKINILKQVKEVLPSRLRFLIETAKDIQSAFSKRTHIENCRFIPNFALRKVLSMKGVKPEDIKVTKKKNSQDWFMNYFEILDALYTGKQISEVRYLYLLNRYMATFISHYAEYDYPYSIFNEGLNLYQYLIQTKTIDISKEITMDLQDLKSKFERTHGLADSIQDENSKDNEGKAKYQTYKNVSEQFFQYWFELSTIYQDNDYCFAFCMGYIANQVRYNRRRKGNFVDDWLSNITTNITKLDYLMTRSIESLSIERCLDSANVKIPLALAAFIKDQGVSIDDSTLGYDMVFPFVSGFMFRTSIDDNIQELNEVIQVTEDETSDDE